ncbi:uncharacterized protein LOC135152097 isoform X1 [Daucus carota subsp. sativus]|uniref:uncharacterized protein LOC135152097 isoform X1 n=1 Tax=Daucus carota subsp. sativus TaxID=79200 RepID=UPI0030833C2E
MIHTIIYWLRIFRKCLIKDSIPAYIVTIHGCNNPGESRNGVSTALVLLNTRNIGGYTSVVEMANVSAAKKMTAYFNKTKWPEKAPKSEEERRILLLHFTSERQSCLWSSLRRSCCLYSLVLQN